ncbi:MAG: rhomboid family intramembrane serine protease [Phycisphaerales bacterium]|nr:MAG: rhomboid family intramembrane serine protease [Phycisphaerales bacterium]
MGISDRDYIQDKGGSARLGPMGGRRGLSVNLWLIIINVAVYILSGVWTTPVQFVFESAVIQEAYADSDDLGFADPRQHAIQTGPASASAPIVHRPSGRQVGEAHYRVMDPLRAYGHFSTTKAFLEMQVWRLITFQFLHDRASILHILFNMIGLAVFGGLVEQHLGGKRYLAFYLMCGICGGLAYLALNLGGYLFGAVPGLLPYNPTTPLIGASAGVFGVILACSRLAPHERVQLLFPPVSFKIRTFAFVYVGIALLNLLFGGRNAGGDAAHLGGALAGWYFIKHNHLLRDFFDVFQDSRKPDRGRSRGSKGKARGPAPSDPGEIDRILDKVRDQGIESLTDRERKALQSETSRRRGR